MDKRYRARMVDVLQFIEENLHESLFLYDIAAVSQFSPYHFHRIFHGAIGETINEYVGRRRQERAANMLAFDPTLFPFRDESSQLEMAGSELSVAIQTLPVQMVATLSSAGGYEEAALLSTWQQLIDWATDMGIPPDRQTRFAFCYDSPMVTPLAECRYEAALVIDPKALLNLPFRKAEIPAGKYAILHFKGAIDDIGKAQLGFYAHWLPASGYEPDAFPLLERYLDVEPGAGLAEIELYIKLRRLDR